MRRLLAAPLFLLACSNARPVVDGYRHNYLVHPDGILDQASPDFHGTLLKDTGWDFSQCQKCHGDDLKGGGSGVNCWSCHQDGGPTGCTTCHGQPPQTGAHVAHVVNQGHDCSTCHVKPMVYTDSGHLDGKVEVTLEKGTYQDGSCSGVYCHGGTVSDSNAKNTMPKWKGGPSEASCGSCHGLGPSGHVSNQCIDCHPKQFDGSGSRHVDGKISLGDESGNCNSCHTLTPASGAHTGHLTAPLMLRGPLTCTDCHKVPTTIDDPAHPVTAKAQGCEKCHGKTPTWNPPDVTAAYCGACHGVPPVDAPHTTQMTLNDCATCHPTTISPGGGFVPGGTHINGVVDAQ